MYIYRKKYIFKNETLTELISYLIKTSPLMKWLIYLVGFVVWPHVSIAVNLQVGNFIYDYTLDS